MKEPFKVTITDSNVKSISIADRNGCEFMDFEFNSSQPEQVSIWVADDWVFVPIGNFKELINAIKGTVD